MVFCRSTNALSVRYIYLFIVPLFFLRLQVTLMNISQTRVKVTLMFLHKGRWKKKKKRCYRDDPSFSDKCRSHSENRNDQSSQSLLSQRWALFIQSSLKLAVHTISTRPVVSPVLRAWWEQVPHSAENRGPIGFTRRVWKRARCEQSFEVFSSKVVLRAFNIPICTANLKILKRHLLYHKIY